MSLRVPVAPACWAWDPARRVLRVLAVFSKCYRGSPRVHVCGPGHAGAWGSVGGTWVCGVWVCLQGLRAAGAAWRAGDPMSGRSGAGQTVQTRRVFLRVSDGRWAMCSRSCEDGLRGYDPECSRQATLGATELLKTF